MSFNQRDIIYLPEKKKANFYIYVHILSTIKNIFIPPIDESHTFDLWRQINDDDYYKFFSYLRGCVSVWKLSAASNKIPHLNCVNQ